MEPVRIKGANGTLAEEQPEYTTLSIRRGYKNIPELGGMVHYQACAFRPTAQELAALNRGENITLTILGHGWPPVNLEVGDIDAPEHDNAC